RRRNQLNDSNQEVVELIAKLTQLEAQNKPGITQKIIQQGIKMIKDHPIKSVAGGAGTALTLLDLHAKAARVGGLRVENLQAQLAEQKTTIATVQGHLKVSDLTRLPTLPNEKGLQDLINFFNNPPVACSETNHQELKLAQGKEIIQQIISELELGLDKDSSLTQTIAKIKDLIARPDNANNAELEKQLSEAQKIIQQLEQQKTPFGEKLQVIIQIDNDYLSQR
ncbi:hypothetical protein C1645_852308, partial [Glomus cerebriforme]